jgi:prepilin-type N-terminal cleavage/methylation domain-containing protein
MKKVRSGFTLIELMVVIVIIMVLAAAGLATYSAAQLRARNTKRIGDMKVFQTSYEQYFTVNQTYLATCSSMDSSVQLVAPTEPKTGHAGYSLSCTTTSYCICALLEPETGTTYRGNSSNSTCSFDASPSDNPYYCVVNQQ